MKILLVISALLLVSCASLVGHESGVEQGISNAKPFVDIVDPLTGGVAGIIYTGVAGLASTIFGVNRALVARKRGQAIKEIDKNPDTPDAKDQVTGSKAQRVIIQVVGAKLSS